MSDSDYKNWFKDFRRSMESIDETERVRSQTTDEWLKEYSKSINDGIAVTLKRPHWNPNKDNG
jgi:hypothetical protein|tara:strand:+ start:128 stop:316 length:189 start_codon:yes stop_codon:yes gene_type:complete